MSYYFTIIGTKDNPLFEHEFGTSKQGGDGVARFREEARHMNQFIAHASLDIVEEVQWASGQMYLKLLDRFPPSTYISAFITANNVKFLLLTCPTDSSSAASTRSSSIVSSASARSSSYPSSATYNPTAPATEEAVKNFFYEVYDAWLKTLMSPFYHINMPIGSPVFRARVQAAAKKYL